MEPLAVAIIWNNEDYSKVKEYVDYISDMLAEDVNKPFSRNIRIPIFYYQNINDNELPSKINLDSDKKIIYVFLSVNCAASEVWADYYKDLHSMKNTKVVGIALDRFALNLSCEDNFIRLYDFEKFTEEYLYIYMMHELYRYINTEVKSIVNHKSKSKDSALKIFISHTKKDELGRSYSESLKNVIDNSTLTKFFDVTDIAPSYDIADEIENNLDSSSIVILDTDNYDSRYWCQKEILYAKKKKRPIIEVDLCQNYVDRNFPYKNNVPVLNLSNNKSQLLSNKKDYTLKILETVITETIRFDYSKMKIDYLLNKNNINDITVFSRPPEMIDIINEDLRGTIIYPEPMLLPVEKEILSKQGVEVKTVMQYLYDSDKRCKVGLSISEVESNDELIEIGQTDKHLKRLSQALAINIAYQGSQLIYGGDFRPNGFTRELLAQAEAINSDRLERKDKIVVNYVAWPLYNRYDDKVKEFLAKYRSVLKYIETKAPDFIENSNEYIDWHVSAENRYSVAKSLTIMRNEMIKACECRICAGGKRYGYSGCMPGVLEEVYIGFLMKKPMFLLGGFGGVIRDVCNLIETKQIPESFTVDYQVKNNYGYRDLLDCYNKHEDNIDYNSVIQEIINGDLRNGLSKEENLQLFHTSFIDEAINLINKGINNII